MYDVLKMYQLPYFVLTVVAIAGYWQIPVTIEYKKYVNITLLSLVPTIITYALMSYFNLRAIYLWLSDDNECSIFSWDINYINMILFTIGTMAYMLCFGCVLGCIGCCGVCCIAMISGNIQDIGKNLIDLVLK